MVNHHTILHRITQYSSHSSTQQYTTVHNSTQQYTTVHNSTQQYTTVHHSTQQYTTVHHSTQQYTTVHNSTLASPQQHRGPSRLRHSWRSPWDCCRRRGVGWARRTGSIGKVATQSREPCPAVPGHRSRSLEAVQWVQPDAMWEDKRATGGGSRAMGEDKSNG
jgi:hypothetical protein